MARRFSDINRGPLLNEAYQRRQAYLSRTIAERNATSRVGQRASSPALYLGVVPFGEELASGVAAYRVRSTLRNREAVADFVGGRAVFPLPATAIQNSAFVPAQIKLFRQTSTRTATSAITGLRYTQRVGENFSYPFGQTGTEREFEAFNEITNNAFAASPNNKVSYRPEKIRRN